MRLQKRNTVPFRYFPYVGETEKMNGGMHTGEMEPRYGVPFDYMGNLSVPSGMAQANLFGLNTPYTHVLLTEPGADIEEHGMVECGNVRYDVAAVRKSLNVVSVALRKRTVSSVAFTMPEADDEDD